MEKGGEYVIGGSYYLPFPSSEWPHLGHLKHFISFISFAVNVFLSGTIDKNSLSYLGLIAMPVTISTLHLGHFMIIFSLIVDVFIAFKS